MAIFINDGQSNIYRSKAEIKEPNQRQVVVDRFSEWVKKQQKVNRNLTRSYNMLNQLTERHDHTQKNILQKLNDFESRHTGHEKFKEQTLQRFSSINQKQMKVEDWMKQEQQAKAQLMDELRKLHDSNQQIIEELLKQDDSNEELAEQLKEIFAVQQQISEQILSYDEQQKQIVNQLENQEALIEKVARQMTNFRSILYERSHHLAEKIEDNYELTSSYVHQLLSGKENPMTFMVSKQKDDD